MLPDHVSNPGPPTYILAFLSAIGLHSDMQSSLILRSLIIYSWYCCCLSIEVCAALKICMLIQCHAVHRSLNKTVHIIVLLLKYSWTSMARTPMGPWKLVRGRGSLSQWGLIWISFRFSLTWRYNEYTQYTIFNIKKKLALNFPKSAAMVFVSKGLKNEFETAVVNEPSVFEPLKIEVLLYNVQSNLS